MEQRIKRYAHLLHTLPPDEIVFRLRRKADRHLKDARQRTRYALTRGSISDLELRHALKSPLDADAMTSICPLGAVGERGGVVELLRRYYPDRPAEIARQADDFCEHRFDLLGSGPVELGPHIDWQRDFKSGFRWPGKFYKDIAVVDLNNDADVKTVWDLSRSHHMVTMGQAYYLTGDEKYTREFLAQFHAWLDENPWMEGAAWACTMDVAIRIINWSCAFALFGESPEITAADRKRLLKAVLAHGRHIMDNFQGELGNHLISDIVGLIYLGVLFPCFKDSCKWLDTGTRAFLEEVKSQVLPDGVDYEASTSYHRLVGYMVAAVVGICRLHDVPLPAEVAGCLEKMVEYTLHYTRPDGTAPIIGDIDNGHLLRLTAADENDHRELLAMGAALFGRADFRDAAGDMMEEALWWFGPGVFAELQGMPPSDREIGSCSFPDGGVYVMRGGDRHMVVDCGFHQPGMGHAHNDTLSFDLFACGRPFIIDPGTYVYTSSVKWRNHFRSGSAHNTVMVDDTEMNRFYTDNLFLLERDAEPTVERWETSESYDLLVATHDGYGKLPSPVIHRRGIYFDKNVGCWWIRDELLGEGTHNIRIFYHLESDLTVSSISDTSFLVGEEGGRSLVLSFRDDLPPSWRVGQGWISRSYGSKEEAPVLELYGDLELPAVLLCLVYPVCGGEKPTKTADLPPAGMPDPFTRVDVDTGFEQP